MQPSLTQPFGTAPADKDLASQDPEPAAQIAPNPQKSEREAKSTLLSGSMLAGMAMGAAIGIGVAGRVGAVVGASLGAVVGALGGATAGATASPTTMDGASVAETASTAPVRLHIEDSGGRGRPLVLIHGWPLSVQAWEPQVAVLQAAGYRVVAYDRRGFGRSDKPESGYNYDTLADDLQYVMDHCGLQDATLVGFSMGGGEVARYITRHGESRLHSVVFAAAVPPYLMQTADNPDGPLTPEKAQQGLEALAQDRNAFFDHFTRDFFSAQGVLQVTESQRSEALAVCHQSAPHAALACMEAFGATDFREDLKRVTVPTLVVHGEADVIVPIAGSGLRTHHAVRHSQFVKVSGAPHGMNLSHAQVFNNALLSFLRP